MSVSVRRKGAKWQANVYLVLPNGRRFRERVVAPIASKEGALRWAQVRERERLEELLSPKGGATKERAPTLAAFVPRVLEVAIANRRKPSTVEGLESILRVHLVPLLGDRRLDEIHPADVEALKARLSGRAAKTARNVVSTLGAVLNLAVEMGVLERLPCKVRAPKAPKTHAEFHDFATYARLVEAARRVDLRALVIVLLGGDAGLRAGEMRALRWTDLDVSRRQLRVQRSLSRGQETAPKSGRARAVRMTGRLAAALGAHRHLKGPRVLCHEDGGAYSPDNLRTWVRRAARVANVGNDGVHVLRHTFCSHLAMRGVPARAIMELAGHANLETTLRYMHLSPGAGEEAIRLLEASWAEDLGTPVALGEGRGRNLLAGREMLASPTGFEPVLPP